MMGSMATSSTPVGTLITVAPTGAEHATADLPRLPTTHAAPPCPPSCTSSAPRRAILARIPPPEIA